MDKKRVIILIDGSNFSKSSSSNLRKACDSTINLSKIITKFEIKKSPALSEDHAGH